MTLRNASFSLFTFLTVYAFPQQWQESDAERERIIKNKIKKITITSPGQVFITSYDHRGYPLHRLTRSLDGVLQLECACDTSAQGMISVCKQRQFEPDGNVTHERHSFYDALARSAHDLEYEDGILTELTQYHYGEHGLTRKERLLPDKTLIYVTEYAYDANGHLVEDHGTTSDVDSTGQRFYYTDRTYTYRNDTIGREIERSYIVKGKVLTRCYSTYDDNGNYVEFKVCDPDGGLRSKDVFTYDKNGNVVGISHMDGISETRRSTKTYDNMGNTLRIINFRNGKDADVITYAYEFYAF